MRNNGLCTKEEGERLLSFTNNSGPLFIIGTVGISLFGNTTIGLLLFITHLLSSITVGICFKFWKKNKYNHTKSFRYTRHSNSNIKLNNLGEIFSKSISSSISSVVLISGFVVFFSVIISILNNSGFFNICTNILKPLFNILNIKTEYIKPILSGLIELTNGLKLVSIIHVKKISISILICSFLLGFGGFSILLQVFSIISKSDLSIKPYLYGKVLHGAFATLYTFIFLFFLPIFNFNF